MSVARDALIERSRAVVLVEGISDKVALEALAARRGRDLVAENVAVVPIGGRAGDRPLLEDLQA